MKIIHFFRLQTILKEKIIQQSEILKGLNLCGIGDLNGVCECILCHFNVIQLTRATKLEVLLKYTNPNSIRLHSNTPISFSIECTIMKKKQY